MKRKNRTKKRWRYLKALWRRKGKQDKQVHPDWSPNPMAGLDLDVWKETLPDRVKPEESTNPLPEWMMMVNAMDKTIQEHPELFQ